ncbi:TetM/TetW/TetO/TetS family tetracycline resistance ribosomal protection protein [Natronosporangium hydrolyticum]|uniref:TetM/TetW/TetO/TetS family tetracycline resistance ribosomal protection protein n=1 Tax=Natronosporangium hydrolyticum TaxID=2811111 RepID=A0A895YH16_9ACTN|nr:TetM/TetW/TetO/TetS family tetracycline resistance ribosomal protection protein [Natronosporangium hydrolyticum]QSB12988.1 TetM/TetW/TetO/TetS family tetracycline resistance ribosomal protection protein [Natronosporangium hydrolyticum]
MPLLNLGVVAHVDAGKTSLTERLLFEAGVLDEPGSVDDGTTNTDSMELERRRGITIRAAVTSFAIDGLVVNLVDTPGHPDFIAEVERSLAVLDAAVLVVSSVEGVQPQTVVIWRALRRIGVPTVLFLNKVDRAGADVARTLAQVRARLTPHAVMLAEVADAGRRNARVRQLPLDSDPVIEAVADVDDGVLAAWLAGERVSRRRVRRAIRRGVPRNAATPVLCGSAVTGAGVPELRRALVELLPPAVEQDGPLAGTVFAVDRDEVGRRAWLRLWSGQLRVRDRIPSATARPERVTQLEVSEPGGGVVSPTARAGQIVAVRGTSAQIGHTVGQPPRRRTHRFPPATMQALVEPVDPTQRTALYAGLAELADEDPLVDLRIDQHAGEALISLHGEVQKEVVAALLSERFGIRARFAQTMTACIERVVGAGDGAELIKQDGNPYLAGIGLRIEAAPAEHGVTFSPGIERGRLPVAFITATEEGVRRALRQGPHGWPVTDCTVTMTSSQYWPRQSKPHQKFDKSISSVAADFRNLAPVVVAAALRRAGTRVCHPVNRFELELPRPAHSAVAALLGRLGAPILDAAADGAYLRLVGTLPSARLPRLAAVLPDLTGGEGVLVTRFDHYAPVTDERPPTLRRRGPDPADRQGWFRAVPR